MAQGQASQESYRLKRGFLVFFYIACGSIGGATPAGRGREGNTDLKLFNFPSRYPYRLPILDSLTEYFLLHCDYSQRYFHFLKKDNKLAGVKVRA
jgi:hypothetical protein